MPKPLKLGREGIAVPANAEPSAVCPCDACARTADGKPFRFLSAQERIEHGVFSNA